MPLSNERKKQFRSIGHKLNPVVTIAGNGLSEGVLAELDRALEDHELIKVKLMIADRDTRRQCAAELLRQTGALSIQEIGKVLLIYRAAKRPNARLSNIV